MNSVRKHPKIWTLLSLLWLFSDYTQSAQVPNGSEFSASTRVDMTLLPSFKLVGSASMKWLWFELYQAQVLTPTGTYTANQWPLAINLTYQRSLTAEQLLDATIDEWQRQDIEYRPEWVSKLRSIWPNIKPQDQLILFVDKANISHFFFNNEFIGSLSDTLFASAFSAIWLSNNTLKPALRNQLIGLKP